MKKIDWLIIFSIILVSAILLKDLFKTGYFTSHDGIHQVVRLYYFDKTVRDGQIPPRLADGLLNGFGYPLFTFSYQLPWFLGEAFHFLGFSIFDSIKMTFIAGFILSGIFMYLFQKDLFGRWAAVVGTTLYLIAPYRFSNIFVRAAIGDATSFIFPPLLFFSALKLRKSSSSWIWISLGAIAVSGLLLSHAMVFLFFILCYLFYVGYWFLRVKNKIVYIFRSVLVLVLGFSLSAYYFVPSMTERSLTKFNEIMRINPLGSTYLKFNDLLYSPWGYGTMGAKEGGMSFQLGIAQWFTIISFMAFFIFNFWKNKTKNFDTDKRLDALFYFMIFAGSITLMLPLSSSVWNIINSIAYIDFKWRVLAVSVFTVSILGGYLIHKNKFGLILGVFIITLAFYANRNHLKRNATLDWPLEFYLELESTTNSFDEYIPKWVDNEIVKKKKSLIEPPEEDKKAQIVLRQRNSNLIDFSIETQKQGKVKVNKIYYPGWRAFVEGKQTKIDYNSGGIMQIDIPEGKTEVVFKFGETPLRKISNYISMATLFIMLLGLLKFSRK